MTRKTVPPPTEFAERRHHLLAALPARNADAIVITALCNVRYLCGFTGSNAVLVLAAGSATLFTDPRYTIQAQLEVDCAVKIAKGALLPAAADLIARKKWKRVGIEQNRISYAAFAQLQAHLPPGLALEPVAGLVEAQRMVKSPAEIEWIRSSVRTNSRAFDQALRRWKPGATESDLAAEIEYRMRRLGAEKPAFDTIVASGAHSALPHASPRSQPVEPNRLLLIDMGAFQAGYASDMTRTVHVGKPSPKAKKLYAAVLEAQLAAIDSVREGTTAGDVDRTARQVLKKHGLGELFVHSTGHGLGLEIHEPPRLGKRDATPLQAGMVITIEPGAYEQGFGGVRIEDTVVVTRTGCEVLTLTSKDFVIL